MAAEELARAGAKVTVFEANPSLGRKFLMAGKSGLNLTKSEPLDAFSKHYAEAESWLAPMLDDFGPEQVQEFAEGLGQQVFTGSSGRVFPNAMKASPMLRAWLSRLSELGVSFQTRHHWTGWDGDAAVFQTPEGTKSYTADTLVFALGGASWSRLGSDGAWAKPFAAGIWLEPSMGKIRRALFPKTRLCNVLSLWLRIYGHVKSIKSPVIVTARGWQKLGGRSFPIFKRSLRTRTWPLVCSPLPIPMVGIERV